MKRRFLIMSLSCMSILTLMAFSAFAQAPIKIGSMNVLSGPLGVLGVNLNRTIPSL